MLQMFDIVLEFATFAVVMSIVLLAFRAMELRIAVDRRLGADGGMGGPSQPSSSIVKPADTPNRFFSWVQSATSLKDPTESSRLRRDLARAGFDSPFAPIWYVIARFSLAIALPVLLIAGTTLLGKPLTGPGAYIFPLVLCGVGLIGPRAFIDNRVRSRKTAMEGEFPDALDLMVVCVESGLGLEAAFVLVAKELAKSHPHIAVHLRRMAEEISAGRSRADSLRALADRVDVETIRAFVALLIQADSLGVSVAQSLRTYSTEMRQTRYLRAAEKAMRIPVLMTMPIVGCFMPVIVVALLLPPMIDALRLLGPALALK